MPVEKTSVRKRDAYNPMFALTPDQLNAFLSQFYIIKSKYGYTLGRTSRGIQKSSYFKRNTRKQSDEYELPKHNLDDLKKIIFSKRYYLWLL